MLLLDPDVIALKRSRGRRITFPLAAFKCSALKTDYFKVLHRNSNPIACEFMCLGITSNDSNGIQNAINNAYMNNKNVVTVNDFGYLIEIFDSHTRCKWHQTIRDETSPHHMYSFKAFVSFVEHLHIEGFQSTHKISSFHNVDEIVNIWVWKNLHWMRRRLHPSLSISLCVHRMLKIQKYWLFIILPCSFCWHIQQQKEALRLVFDTL